VCSPFFDHFSPFPTIFESGADTESFGLSSGWRYAPFLQPLENGENGENGEQHV
jgi:hypothetical protein